MKYLHRGLQIKSNVVCHFIAYSYLNRPESIRVKQGLTLNFAIWYMHIRSEMITNTYKQWTPQSPMKAKSLSKM